MLIGGIFPYPKWDFCVKYFIIKVTTNRWKIPLLKTDFYVTYFIIKVTTKKWKFPLLKTMIFLFQIQS